MITIVHEPLTPSGQIWGRLASPAQSAGPYRPSAGTWCPFRGPGCSFVIYFIFSKAAVGLAAKQRCSWTLCFDLSQQSQHCWGQGSHIPTCCCSLRPNSLFWPQNFPLGEVTFFKELRSFCWQTQSAVNWVFRHTFLELKIKTKMLQVNWRNSSAITWINNLRSF